MKTRRDFLRLSCALAAFGIASITPGPVSPAQSAPSNPRAKKLVAAARAQIGVTTAYDPAYRTLAYPDGDVPRSRGVCTDVVIRAYRDGLGLDLQKRVHEDMKAHFAAYPAKWGLHRPDRNIDHRRVPNLQTFFTRQKAAIVPPGPDSDVFLPGDVVTLILPGALDHVVIVSDTMTPDGKRPLVIHNIGNGTQEEDALSAFRISGQYRFF